MEAVRPSTQQAEEVSSQTNGEEAKTPLKTSQNKMREGQMLALTFHC